MGDKSAIGWTDATWNPTKGCSVLSPGCANCYAMREAARQVELAAGAGRASAYAGLTIPSKAGPVWNGRITLDHAALDLPLRWSRPRRIFVDSMSDLFHPGVPFDFVDEVVARAAVCPRHVFQLLTKRADRQRAYFATPGRGDLIEDHVRQLIEDRVDPLNRRSDDIRATAQDVSDGGAYVPLANLHVGVSVEDQARLNDRVATLLETPAAVRWVSAEPLLGAIDFRNVGSAGPDTSRLAINALTGRVWRPDGAGGSKGDFGVCWPALDWVVLGGESGPGSRPLDPTWARGVRDQCVDAGVAFDFKQWGDWAPFRMVDGEPRLHDGRSLRLRHRETRHAGDADWVRLGKREAGRLLDGRVWDQRPAEKGPLI